MNKKILTTVYYAFFALLCGFILSSAFTLHFACENYSNIYFIESAGEIDISLLLLLTLFFSAGLFCLFFFGKKLYRCALSLCLLDFSLLTLWQSKTYRPYYAIVMEIITAAFTLVFKDIYHDRKIKPLEALKGRGLYIAVLVETVLMTALVSYGTIIRYYTFNSSAFDFGLFVQMFESMATDLTQNTTLERGEILSHFAVHFSPIYYLLLPFYMIFRSPEGLLAMQAAVCFSGVIPLLLLCKKWRYSNAVTLAVTSVFLCVPAFTGGCFYDFHENCFLVPVILWLLYFTEKNNAAGMMISALLLLCVKEDAGIYVIFIGIYALLNKRVSKISSICLTLIGISGFVAITKFIDMYGEGIKVSRYDAYLYGGQESLADVIVNVVKNPAFFFSRLLNEEKLIFLLQMLLPFMFIPMKTKKLGDWLLMAPLLIVNLATEYGYQYSVAFQYAFGTAALLVFLFAKNLRYEKRKLRSAMACLMAAAIILLGANGVKYRYSRDYSENKEYYDSARQLLETIPRDKVIYANTYLTPMLADCPQLYQYPPVYQNENTPAADYILIDSRGAIEENLQPQIDEIEGMGYRREENGTFILVYVR
ncbi:MAG: DUF2079 domain-containing protein [Firmicutes bacterium]|nr:DUF2079 domain-containing protein [Bacillota bacterium]